MKIEAIVKVDNAEARFAVSQTGPGMYSADLIGLNGQPSRSLPQRVILLRSFRHWTGSCDNENLLNELGRAIDSVVREAPIFNRNEERGGSPEQVRKR